MTAKLVAQQLPVAVVQVCPASMPTLIHGPMQGLDYKDESVLGIAATWPQTAAMVPSPDDWFDWEGDRPLNIPLEELVIYELHVRGFTQHGSAHANAPGKPCLLRLLHSGLPLPSCLG